MTSLGFCLSVVAFVVYGFGQYLMATTQDSSPDHMAMAAKLWAAEFVMIGLTLMLGNAFRDDTIFAKLGAVNDRAGPIILLVFLSVFLYVVCLRVGMAIHKKHPDKKFPEGERAKLITMYFFGFTYAAFALVSSYSMYPSRVPAPEATQSSGGSP